MGILSHPSCLVSQPAGLYKLPGLVPLALILPMCLLVSPLSPSLSFPQFPPLSPSPSLVLLLGHPVSSSQAGHPPLPQARFLA